MTPEHEDPFSDIEEPTLTLSESGESAKPVIEGKQKPLTLSDFAEIIGYSKMSVSRACKVGRLKQCVVRDAKGRAVGITDPELAKREWEANTDPTRKPDSGSPEFQDSKAEKEHWAALTAQLKFKEAAGDLVPVAGVRQKMVDTFAVCRTKLLAIPSRAKQNLVHLTVEDVARLEELVREALEDLAGE